MKSAWKMGLEQKYEKSPCSLFLSYIESHKNAIVAERPNQKFNHIGHPNGPKLPCVTAKYFWVQTSLINMRNENFSKFTSDGVIRQFPWVPPSTSYATQSLGPCSTPQNYNEVKNSSWTKDNIVYLPFNVISLIYGNI